MNLRQYLRVLLILTGVSLAVFLLAIAVGSAYFSPAELLHGLFAGGDSTVGGILWQLRIPRAATAFVVGGMLATAGVLMQVLLRNPLADPYILGVSGGAAVFALLAIMFGLGALWISAGAFTGAIVSMLLVFTLAHGKGGWSTLRLLLTGVVVAAGWGALISFMLAVSPDTRVHGMLFWLMGDLSRAEHAAPGLLVLLIGLAASLACGRSLNILARGDMQALALGVNTGRLRVLLYFLASLLSAGAVTLAGSVGFVGLLAPHLLRMCGVADHRLLLPAAALFGGSLLMLADTLARVILAPEQLPVGVVTALLGVPLYLLILNRGATRI